MADISSLSRVGPWGLTELLGQNGVVGTYLGSRDDGTPKAVVVLDASQLADPMLPARTAPRIQALKSLPASRIAGLADFGEADGVVYCAYDRLKGDHLGNRVGQQGLPTPARSLEIIRQAVEALDSLHHAGFVHMLVTPASIFINEIEQVKLLHAGWGPIVLGVQGGAAHPALMSNLPFLAPEVCAGGEATEASDVFSIGANLYYLLCGAPVHWLDDPAQLCQAMATQPIDTSPLAAHVPPDVVGLVQELLELDPEERPINFEALRERLDTMAGDLYRIAEDRSERDVVAPVEEPPTAAPTGPPESQVAPDMGPPPPVPPPMETAPAAPEMPAPPPPSQEQFTPPPAVPGPQSPASPAGAPEPAPAEAGEPKPDKKDSKRGKGGGSKGLVIGGVAVVALVVLVAVGWAVMTLLGSGGGDGGAQTATNATPTPRPTPRPEQERERLEPWISTVEGLALAAEVNRAFFNQVGRYPNNDMEPVQRGIVKDDLSVEDLTDGWGTQMDFRRQWVFSAGPDTQWNTQDDLYVDTTTNVLSAVAPGVRLPDDDPAIQRWQAALGAFAETREQGYAPASGDAAGAGDSGAAPEG